MNTTSALEYLNDMAYKLDAVDIANYVLKNEAFIKCSGSSSPNSHHYGTGQLIVHVAEVAQLCLMNNFYLDFQINSKLLFLAVLFHDFGKVWDYSQTSDGLDWFANEHRRTIHHINRSALEWQKAAESYGFPDSEIDAVLHAILAHHGFPQWGSPVQPKSKMAWMLHLCDGISARMNDADRMDRPF